jgi:hypothetical protein
MRPHLYRGRAIIPSPFCSGDPDNKSFQAHPWLRVGLTAFECPVCEAFGRI